MVKNRVPLFCFRVDCGLLRTHQLAVKIREPETPQLANPQAADNTVAGITLEGFRVDFHNGRSLLTVQ